MVLMCDCSNSQFSLFRSTDRMYIDKTLLIKDILDHDEEEFEFDYDISDMNNLLDKFDESRWLDLSEDEELVGMYDKEIVDRKVYNTKIKSAENEGLARGLEKRNKRGY